LLNLIDSSYYAASALEDEIPLPHAHAHLATGGFNHVGLSYQEEQELKRLKKKPAAMELYRKIKKKQKGTRAGDRLWRRASREAKEDVKNIISLERRQLSGRQYNRIQGKYNANSHLDSSYQEYYDPKAKINGAKYLKRKTDRHSQFTDSESMVYALYYLLNSKAGKYAIKFLATTPFNSKPDFFINSITSASTLSKTHKLLRKTDQRQLQGTIKMYAREKGPIRPLENINPDRYQSINCVCAKFVLRKESKTGNVHLIVQTLYPMSKVPGPNPRDKIAMNTLHFINKVEKYFEPEYNEKPVSSAEAWELKKSKTYLQHLWSYVEPAVLDFLHFAVPG